jgi:transcriptional regulator with XRE-family HTH domain
MDGMLSYPTVMARRVTKMDEEPTASASAIVFGRNLSALMAANKELGSNQKVSKKTGVSTSTVSRLLNGQVDATLETVERVAKAFRVEAWQLLVPNLEADNLPELLPHTKHERRLWERLREVAREIKET